MIGVLNQNGEQVGGVFNWSIGAVLSDGIMGKWTAVKATKVVTANSYWLIKKPSGYIYEAEFYRQIRGRLVLMDAGRVELKLPDTTTLDRTLSAPLRLTWIWDD